MKTSPAAKMFGALVLGSGTLLSSPQVGAEPSKQPPPKPVKSNVERPSLSPAPPQSATPPPTNQPKRDPYCQLEFTLHRYEQRRPITEITCLDGKSDAEILKIVKEAKTHTCQSPFCGCWLG